jgi:hypothetical protein
VPLGECIYENFKVISGAPTTPDELDLPKSIGNDCCFSMPVLAEVVRTKDANNDISSVIWFYDQSFSAVALELEKCQNGWTKVDDLNNDDNGTFNSFGYFVNQFNEKAISYVIDWQKVLTLFGEGYYRVKTVETSVFGTTNKYSMEWQLQIYTPERAYNTIRFNWYMNGVRNDLTTYGKKRDFGTINLQNQIRVRGWFGNNKVEQEREEVLYQSGELVWTKDELTEVYECFIGRVPSYIHKVLQYETFFADTLTVTDYNGGDNPNSHIDTPIILTSGYEPKWYRYSNLASVELQFKNRFKIQRKRC